MNTTLRIQRARQKAAESNRSAWWVGHSNNLHCDVYMVGSQKGEWMYYQEVYTHYRAGGYNYGDPEEEPEKRRWIKCTCDAFKLYGIPCAHGAKVQMHLEARERFRVTNVETDLEGLNMDGRYVE